MAALFIIPETWRKKGKGAKIKEQLSKVVNPYDGSVLDQTILESGLQSQVPLVRKIPLLSSSVKWVYILKLSKPQLQRGNNNNTHFTRLCGLSSSYM